MKKRRFKPTYHCSKLHLNIIEKQSYCQEKCENKKCIGCSYRVEIDHSEDIKPFDIVKEGNQLIDEGCKREQVLIDLISKYNLNKSEKHILKRHLKYNFIKRK